MARKWCARRHATNGKAARTRLSPVGDRRGTSNSLPYQRVVAAADTVTTKRIAATRSVSPSADLHHDVRPASVRGRCRSKIRIIATDSGSVMMWLPSSSGNNHIDSGPSTSASTRAADTIQPATSLRRQASGGLVRNPKRIAIVPSRPRPTMTSAIAGCCGKRSAAEIAIDVHIAANAARFAARDSPPPP